MRPSEKRLYEVGRSRLQVKAGRCPRESDLHTVARSLALAGMLITLILSGRYLVLSHIWGNAGLVLLTRTADPVSGKFSLVAAAQSEPLLVQAVAWHGSNRGAHRGLAVVHTLLRRPEEALQAWRAGVVTEDREVWNDSLWYRVGTALDSNLNEGITPGWYEGEYLVIDSFASATAWKLCPWCDNVPGHSFGARNGRLEMRYCNVSESRSGFAVISDFIVQVEDDSELLLRVRGRPGTLVVVEAFVDGGRHRLVNYREVPKEWDTWSVPINEGLLSRLVIGIWEREAVSAMQEYHLLIDWVALR